ncbi:prolyl oligopeptidase [Metarhizium guizhouense ARSEF 977]|uniref:Prolyl oligopeptidase n=1 Tax=Metarhizium guizhouense (strain ARSEF 977) TaxID=1276136 RepID=A0A0B4GJA4_METGA|nr:prolyl oligopeptidase [Metarhizium guizhouense ARSEF 977]
MLPEPALSFTIPSLHDGTVLDCRVYHPASLAAANPRAPPWERHAAVVAHPYAPMGGCYDDPTLDSVAAALLRTGYLVATFNFSRGAGHSAGRTSWTARPERDDYASVVGFTLHYAHFLDPFADEAPRPQRPVLLMGGYSYGAMVTAQMPPLDRLLEPFARPRADSHAAQVRLRAQHLAEQQNLVLGSARSARRPGAVRVGGEEPPGETLPAVEGLLRPRPAYLLVSPLQGVVTHLATMALLPWPRAGRRRDDDAGERKLVENATLAVFGDRDVFVPVGRLRAWVARLGGQGSMFAAREVASAGHFWGEDGVLDLMTESVEAFAAGLMRGA